jgi:iron complex transport system substrate-binding protein
VYRPRVISTGNKLLLPESLVVKRRSMLALMGLWLAGCKSSLAKNSKGIRVVSLSPNTTETMFALGAGSLLVGRSRYCNYPSEVKSLPEVGGYIDPNLEAILALSPSLVIGARGPAGPKLVKRLQGYGVETYFPPTESLAEIATMIRGVAQRIAKKKAGENTIAKIEQLKADVRKRVHGRARPRVLVLFGLSPISVAGVGSFAHEMLGLAGAHNAVADAVSMHKSSYPTLGLEQVIALDPDMILNTTAMVVTKQADLPKPWQVLRAVKTGKVVEIKDESVLRPGPRIGEGIQVLAKAVHPEVFAPQPSASGSVRVIP